MIGLIHTRNRGIYLMIINRDHDFYNLDEEGRREFEKDVEAAFSKEQADDILDNERIEALYDWTIYEVDTLTHEYKGFADDDDDEDFDSLVQMRIRLKRVDWWSEENEQGEHDDILMDLILDNVSYFDQKFNMYNLMELDDSSRKYIPVCTWGMHVIVDWCVKTSDDGISIKIATDNTFVLAVDCLKVSIKKLNFK